MIENKNSAAGAGTPNDAKITGNHEETRKTILSCAGQGGKSRQQEISEKLIHLLPHGRENAVSMWELSLALNLSERQTRKAVFVARQSGAIICGDASGYYQPQTREELRRYYFRARKRAKSCFSSLQAAKRALENIDGQERLQEVE